MGSEAEDFFGKLLAFGLLIAGIGWLLQWVCRKIVENKGPIIVVVCAIAAVFILSSIIRSAARTSKNRNGLLRRIDPVFEQLETELKRQNDLLSDAKSRKQLAEMQKELASLS